MGLTGGASQGHGAEAPLRRSNGCWSMTPRQMKAATINPVAFEIASTGPRSGGDSRASDYGTVNSPSIPSAKCGTPSGVSTKQANT
jgi:hypothetical protein